MFKNLILSAIVILFILLFNNVHAEILKTPEIRPVSNIYKINETYKAEVFDKIVNKVNKRYVIIYENNIAISMKDCDIQQKILNEVELVVCAKNRLAV